MRTLLELMVERDKAASMAKAEETRPDTLDDAIFHLGAAHALEWAMGKNGTTEPPAPSSVRAPRGEGTR